jgi:hypothetical protein
MTSQSTQIVRSVTCVRSITPRSEREINRWISIERPSTEPMRSRDLRCSVDDGSIEYSAVSQPLPRPWRNAGTPSSAIAVHSTFV